MQNNTFHIKINYPSREITLRVQDVGLVMLITNDDMTLFSLTDIAEFKFKYEI